MTAGLDLRSILKNRQRGLIIIKEKKTRGPVFCILAAVIWGLSFVAQKSGASLGTFTFNGLRTVLGGLVLLPFVPLFHSAQNKKAKPGNKTGFNFKNTAFCGTVCGIVLFVASNLQQHAFNFDITAGKVGFITALYMILVPLAGLFSGRKIRLNVWIALALGITGLYFLCIKKGDFTIGRGEIFSILCAVMFAAHILTVDRFCNEVEPVALSCTQFLVAGIISVICMFIFEKPDFEAVLAHLPELLYAGIASTGIAFTLQVFGQKYTEPAVASLLMCLESVFSAIFGKIILHDVMGARAVIGCVIMFAGVILSQLDLKKGKEING